MALARMPPLNHSWGIALQVTPRGLSTRPMPCGDRTFAIEFDFIDHRLAICTSDGTSRSLPLAPRSVASFYADVMHTLDEMGLPVRIWRMPVEIPIQFRSTRTRCMRRITRSMRASSGAFSSHPSGRSPARAPARRQVQSGPLFWVASTWR